MRSNAVAEVDVQLREGQRPVLERRRPFFRDFFDGQIQQFHQGYVAGEGGFCLRHFSKLPVEALYSSRP